MQLAVFQAPTNLPTASFSGLEEVSPTRRPRRQRSWVNSSSIPRKEAVKSLRGPALPRIWLWDAYSCKAKLSLVLQMQYFSHLTAIGTYCWACSRSLEQDKEQICSDGAGMASLGIPITADRSATAHRVQGKFSSCAGLSSFQNGALSIQLQD